MTDWMLSSKESAEAQPPIKQITSTGQLETTAPVPEVADSTFAQQSPVTHTFFSYQQLQELQSEP